MLEKHIQICLGFIDNFASITSSTFIEKAVSQTFSG